MTDSLLRMLIGVTVGLALVLLLRRPARRVFGAGPAFTLWLLPVVLALAPMLPRGLAPAATWSLPAMVVTPHAGAVAHAATQMDWMRWLFALWLAGAVAGLARLAVHYLRLVRCMRRAPTTWSRWLAHVMPDLDPRRVRVHAAGPAVLWALPHALILLPTDFVQRFDSAATRELVLRHELTHARRGDAWWSFAMEIASALLWFHPLVWLARSRFRLDQELACDAASLRVLPQRGASYARALLDSAAVQSVPALIPWLAEPQLKERLAMLTRIPPGALRRRAGFIAVAALLTGGLVVASGQTSALAATQKPPSASNGSIHLSAVVASSGSSRSAPPSVDITYKNRNPPKYPIEALHKGEQGTVLLDVTVDKSGNVVGVTVNAKHTDAAAVLQQAAVAAAVNWKFNPGMKDGHPVGGVLKIPVNFSLDPAWSAGGHCPAGFKYVQGKGKSYSCIHAQPHATAPTSASAS